MQWSVAALLALCLFAPGGDAALLRKVHAQQEPDTSCGKGFDNLVKGSRDYYRTAAVKLFTHPSHRMDNATFEAEFECWFASMCTTKCGELPSRADARKKELTKKCTDVTADWLKIWNMFSSEEVKWFKGNYPAAETGEEGATVHYKQAMQTAKEINKKELLCLTLFTIDDECVKWPYIRFG